MDLLLADGHRAREALVLASAGVPAVAQESRHSSRQLIRWQRAYVHAVQPSQLDLVEARRAAADVLQIKARDQLLGGQHRAVIAAAPPEQGQVVAHRLGQVARVAQFRHRGGAVALGQLAAVGSVQQRKVRVHGHRGLLAQASRLRPLEHEQLLGRVREVVLAAHDVADARVEIVDRDREVVQHGAVRASDHRVVEMDVLEARLATDEVVYDGRSLVRDAQAHRAARLGLPPEPPLGAVAALVFLDVLRGGARAVRAAGIEQRLLRLGVARAALALEHRTLVPVELEPAQRVDDRGHVLGARALAVGVLDPQHELPLLVTREQPVEQRRAGPADVQLPRGRRREANPHNRLAC